MTVQTALPEEAVDVTVSELHQRVLNRLVDVLRFVFRERALVLSDIFLRVRHPDGHEEQVSPDVAIVPGAQPGRRSVYRVPDEPVPATTIEVLSPANHGAEGAMILAEKRGLFSRVGVQTHIEIDPDRGSVTTWHHDGTELVEGEPTTVCEDPALGGLRIELSTSEVKMFLPDGREFIDAPAEMARAEREAARAEREAARAEREAARAGRLSEALRRAGIDPSTVPTEGP
jgi:Uma2 family endonuclease